MSLKKVNGKEKEDTERKYNSLSVLVYFFDFILFGNITQENNQLMISNCSKVHFFTIWLLFSVFDYLKIDSREYVQMKTYALCLKYV